MATDVLAVYPGTFDPITLGHEDVVRRAARLFPRVIVAVAVAHHKKTMFTLEERLSLARTALADCPNVSVASYDGLVRDFVMAQGARVMVRGVRSVADFDYEAQLAGMNRSLMPDVETLFLLPSSQHQYVSSTLVREIATLGGDIDAFVSPGVRERLLERVGRKP